VSTSRTVLKRNNNPLIQKSKEADPTWFMVDLKFKRRLPHFVSLSALKQIKADPSSGPEYLTPDQRSGISEMPLLTQGRLSVQPVSDTAFEAIVLLGERGGFEEESKPSKKKKEPAVEVETEHENEKDATSAGEKRAVVRSPTKKARKKRTPREVLDSDEEAAKDRLEVEPKTKKQRKSSIKGDEASTGKRRSTRLSRS